MPNPLLKYMMIAEAAFCLFVILIMWRRRMVRQFPVVVSLAAIWFAELAVGTSMLYFRKQVGVSLPVAYHSYVYSYWFCEALVHVLTLVILYQIFKSAMAPFKGLSHLGKLVFRWVFCFAVVIAIGIAVVPGQGGLNSYLVTIEQLEQGISILTICVMLFVFFAGRYLSVTPRSHLFGVSLGLGVQGMTGLVLTAWLATHGTQSVYSLVYMIPAIGGIATLAIWGTYFMMPEPERKMVLLPTTSPYFHWNQVSEALGSHPGMVAVSGFTPDMLAPAERKMLGVTAKRLRATASSVVASVEMPSQDHAVAMPR
jgi:hypothetical protein